MTPSQLSTTATSTKDELRDYVLKSLERDEDGDIEFLIRAGRVQAFDSVLTAIVATLDLRACTSFSMLAVCLDGVADGLFAKRHSFTQGRTIAYATMWILFAMRVDEEVKTVVTGYTTGQLAETVADILSGIDYEIPSSAYIRYAFGRDGRDLCIEMLKIFAPCVAAVAMLYYVFS